LTKNRLGFILGNFSQPHLVTLPSILNSMERQTKVQRVQEETVHCIFT
jgi:hypothetical protein